MVSATPEADADDHRADHSGLAGTRVTVGVVVGAVAAALVLANGASWAVAVLCASDIAALVFVVWVGVSLVAWRSRSFRLVGPTRPRVGS